MKTAAAVLSEAGYSDEVIANGMAYADGFEWEDEDERGAYALARILYDDAELERTPKAAWEPCCYADDYTLDDVGFSDATLTNRVFPGWWGDVTDDEEYFAEWQAIGTGPAGESVRIVWQFPAVKGAEPDDDAWPWDEQRYVQSIERID